LCFDTHGYYRRRLGWLRPDSGGLNAMEIQQTASEQLVAEPGAHMSADIAQTQRPLLSVEPVAPLGSVLLYIFQDLRQKVEESEQSVSMRSILQGHTCLRQAQGQGGSAAFILCIWPWQQRLCTDAQGVLQQHGLAQHTNPPVCVGVFAGVAGDDSAIHELGGPQVHCAGAEGAGVPDTDPIARCVQRRCIPAS
jgi:hypothetical protein